ncbi:MAG: Fic family protein, partial [Elusimicrobiota bacterium]
MENKLVPFNPRHTVTPKLLSLIKDISNKIALLNTRQFPKIILAEFERHAREISAFSSTSIEGNTLGLTEVKQVLKNLPQNITNSQKEVLDYNDALVMLNGQQKKHNKPFLTLQLILAIHKIIVRELLIKGKCGVLRKEPVFVNDPFRRKTVYWPPDHQDVPFLMNELINYVKENTSKLDPIILAGIFHK